MQRIHKGYTAAGVYGVHLTGKTKSRKDIKLPTSNWSRSGTEKQHGY